MRLNLDNASLFLNSDVKYPSYEFKFGYSKSISLYFFHLNLTIPTLYLSILNLHFTKQLNAFISTLKRHCVM